MLKQELSNSQFKMWLITGGVILTITAFLVFLKNVAFTGNSPGRFISFQDVLPYVIPSIFVIGLFAGVYYCAYKELVERSILFALGAVGAVVAGTLLNFYDLTKAWNVLYERLDVICVIVGLNILTIVLDESGIFIYLARKIMAKVKNGLQWKVMFIFCFLTYFVSLFVNNITTVMVLIPMMFNLSKYMKFNPVPHLIGMIVASNLGGASTMIGDFPNIIIGTEGKLKFYEFIVYMMPICVLDLFILILYLLIIQKQYVLNFFGKKTEGSKLKEFMEDLSVQSGEFKNNNGVEEKPSEKLMESTKIILKDKTMAKKAIIILAALVVAFLLSDFIGVSPVIIALAGGIAALMFSGIKMETVMERLNYESIIFFAGLFIIVGAAEASGLIHVFSEIINTLSFGNVLVQCILLMWFSAFITAFFNAGPTTALFIPLVSNFQAFTPHHLCWWSLSFGVLAGSSATLTGATSGAVSSNMLKEFSGSKLTFKEYLKFALPISVTFLVISTVYIVLIYVF